MVWCDYRKYPDDVDRYNSFHLPKIVFWGNFLIQSLITNLIKYFFSFRKSIELLINKFVIFKIYAGSIIILPRDNQTDK